MAKQDPFVLDAQVQRMFQAERHSRAGERALRKERFGEALEAFARAAELCPDEGEFVALMGYARFLAARGDGRAVRRATEELRRAVELAPGRETPHVLLARVLREQGDTAGARAAFEQALASNPTCDEAREALESL